ncbi:MAG: hypothetical protein JAY62_07690 [Candidatus Thiodiazotropha endolucinida]|nr:hypothetical protein [Candidatus Thiodiazotropha taylori]MCW4274989.1 hypothetical protein [Candidatus Thiodiazotropha taylori]
MSSRESDFNEWIEIRARVDSIANAVFLIAGGALSLSITVILSNIDNIVLTATDKSTIEYAWYFLLLSIVLALLLKIILVCEKYMLLLYENYMNKHFMKFNHVGWVVGLSSFFLFCGGLYLMVLSATRIVANQP